MACVTARPEGPGTSFVLVTCTVEEERGKEEEGGREGRRKVLYEHIMSDGE